ncbi:poly(ADP-ribose) glycohydrolase-like [Pollicipes pollicipes]|uniref:poly(ADP-ribose) glycohydrolase-like n=1 Tax=Pollicipes pollicipes TaxID=41117 RepID=UPI0018856332|nr:poly(ADP-ribose) glycohydrolase-like [Pollicipes pollicipes]
MTEQAAPSGSCLSAGRLPVVASERHSVFYELPPADTSADQAPSPAGDGADLWDEWHVRLPCSPQSLYPVRQPDGQMKLVKRWTMVQDALLADFNSSSDLERAIKSYNSRYQDKWNFSGLRYFIDEVLCDRERDHLLRTTLPRLARLALRLPEVLRQPVPLLSRRRAHSLSFSQLQVAALLANAFFCTFPRRNAVKRGDRQAEYSSYPDINFNRLYAGSKSRGTAGQLSPRRIEKLKCLMHYFHRVLEREPTGAVTFSRRYLSEPQLPAWAGSSVPLGAMCCQSDGLIEDQEGMLQVDFANKFVGGGVLGDGCVQEEIRFLINPELIVSRLFTEVLDKTECLEVTGCERFSQFEGYADTFRWVAKAEDPSPRDDYCRRRTQVVALDAFHFFQASRQYEEGFLLRELNKAYVGFHFEDQTGLPPVATGNWGCGAFNGDPRLKALLQTMAAALTGRDLTYLTFGDLTLRDDLREVHAFLRQRAVTVGQLYRALAVYGRLHGGRQSRPEVLSFLYSHIGGDEYGSDTDLEREDWSQEVEILPDTESENIPVDDGATPEATAAAADAAAVSESPEPEDAAASPRDRSQSPPTPACVAAQADLLLEAAFSDTDGCHLAAQMAEEYRPDNAVPKEYRPDNAVSKEYRPDNAVPKEYRPDNAGS